MIEYEHGRWGVGFVLRLSGSVFPKALIWAIPSSVTSACIFWIISLTGYKLNSDVSASSVITALGSFISVLGFMVVFRSNLAWDRYWEGAAMVQQMRGEWFNATSSLFSFCSRKKERKNEVMKFQADLVRLMSLLFGSALESLSGSSLEMISQEAINPKSKQFFKSCNDGEHEVRCEVVLQWIQRKIVMAMDEGIVDIAPPILSRAFQELSRGIVKLAAARKINELPFPFHYAQMLAVMLLTYTFGTAVAAGLVMPSWWAAGGASFFNVLVLWSVNYLAAEIEQPFGTDLNDLPIKEEMARMNALLRILLHEQTLVPPAYEDGTSVSPENVMTALRCSAVEDDGRFTVWEPLVSSKVSVTVTTDDLFISPSQKEVTPRQQSKPGIFGNATSGFRPSRASAYNGNVSGGLSAYSGNVSSAPSAQSGNISSGSDLSATKESGQGHERDAPLAPIPSMDFHSPRPAPTAEIVLTGGDGHRDCHDPSSRCKQCGGLYAIV